jgi:xanthine/CO dehydrogenase XdhC/CoxF family maturation factor
LNHKKLGSVFDEWSGSGQPMVLASVYSTEGSTYSKAGAQMLITGGGVFQGMLSGGCLEGDLAERAQAVASSGAPQAVTYDLGQDDDELWGLGVGCDGLIRVFLQSLSKENDYQPFRSMQAAFNGNDVQVCATVVGSSVAGLDAGTALVLNGGTIQWSDIDQKYHDQIRGIADRVLSERRSQTRQMDIGNQSCELLFTLLRPYPKILVLGAGMDAVPVVRFIAELGWRAFVSDHRPAYADNDDFSVADAVSCIDAQDIGKKFDLDQYDAAIVMSHHLVTDEHYLRQLAASRIPYIGLLGPRHRRERLMKNLGDDGQTLEGRLYGPAGLDINASGPASIALSIVAQLQQQITKSD